ncbi:MAG: FIST C-terminal domain-containing protein [Candidatus Omnitrophica bacterium]|nr:FIST C-terminal domain-containing protein [Candidatus Omnitrophota bacterium]MCB9768040.1 FIST C-terminal domain-containing protein [Candidatus Omnitrophota bacterium]
MSAKQSSQVWIPGISLCRRVEVENNDLMSFQFASGVSNSMGVEDALDSVFFQIREGFSSEKADLAILFTTGHFADSCVDISRRINETFSPTCMVGCTAGGVIGSDQEYEDQAALALLVGNLPECQLNSFHLTHQNVSGIGDAAIAAEILGARPDEDPSFVLLPDPFSIQTGDLLSKLDSVYPGAPKLGGLASAGFQPGSNRLYLNEDTHMEGLVGFSLTGPLEILPVVSQGCRPIGRPLMVTDAERNVIKTLGNRSAFEVLQEIVSELSEEDQRLASTALLTGVVIDEYKTDFDQGDFLIRNLIGGDPERGYLVINDHISLGQTMQFQVRDANTAEEELSILLNHHLARLGIKKPVAAAVFNCNGRGLKLFPERNHDIDMIQTATGGIPSAGFFCAGEIGPVGGQTFIHGFTSSIGLFVPKQDVE